MINCLIVGLGGFLGSVFRYLLGMAPFSNHTGFPISTFIINVTGALFIGLLVGLTDKSGVLSPSMILFFKVGVCGGFTTFSTFALETSQLLTSNHPFIAAFYGVSSVLICILAVYFGQWLILSNH